MEKEKDKSICQEKADGGPGEIFPRKVRPNRDHICMHPLGWLDSGEKLNKILKQFPCHFFKILELHVNRKSEFIVVSSCS